MYSLCGITNYFAPKIFKKFIFHLWLWKPTLYLSTKKSFIFILNLWCFSCCRLMYAKVYLVHSRHGFFLMFYLQEINCQCFLPYFDVYYWLSIMQLLSALGILIHIFKTEALHFVFRSCIHISLCQSYLYVIIYLRCGKDLLFPFDKFTFMCRLTCSTHPICVECVPPTLGSCLLLLRCGTTL